MQKQIEYVPEPFAKPAETAGMTQPELFAMADDMKERKMLRRFAAILRHQKAGYRSNAMGVWAVPAGGRRPVRRHHVRVSQHQPLLFAPDLSRLALQPVLDDSRKSKEDCETIAREVQKKTGIENYAMLYSTREFKKPAWSISRKITTLGRLSNALTAPRPQALRA